MRRLGALVPVLLAFFPLLPAGCADDPVTQPSFVPLTYTYLRPLRLNVGAVTVSEFLPSSPGSHDRASFSPIAPAEALRQMARDRLVASGSSGQAVFTIEQASITGAGDMLDGLLKVRLDIYTSDGQRAAYAEAAVARSSTVPDVEDAMPAALYGLTRQMMSDMNVELEFQLRRTLGDWMQGVDAPVATRSTVSQQVLAPPSMVKSHSPTLDLPPNARFRLIPSPLPSPTPLQTVP